MMSVSEQIRSAAAVVADSLAAAETAGASTTASLPAVVCGLTDDRLRDVLVSASALKFQVDALIAAGAGAVAKRSERELGYTGLASREGFRSPEAMLQSITGSSRGEAARQVRLGEAMGEADAAVRFSRAADDDSADDSSDDGSGFEPGADAGADGEDGSGSGSGSGAMRPARVPWSEPITRAVAERVLSPEGAAAIIHGMGEPNDRCDTEAMRAAARDLLADLVACAADNPNRRGAVTVLKSADELARRARQTRDRLDPVGVTERFQRHYDERSWRMSRNAHGARTAWVQFDDESAAWVESIVSAGMRPRRGGPRFVDKAEAERAERLREDPRTNDQLVFDLLMDVMRAGALADPTIAYGSRQPGVRVITTREELDKTDAQGNLAGVAYLQETGETVPPEVLERILCDTGTKQIEVDADGNPLDVGREQRLFTTKQREALAYRDGGCMDPDCDRPASYAEAHHVDEWAAHHGLTNVDDGILLCRYHHMKIHNEHWRVRRRGSVYWLVPPEGDSREPIRLRTKAVWRQQQAG